MTEVKKKGGIWEKIFQIQQEVSVVEKKGWNEYHKYNYVKEEDFIAQIKPLLKKHKLAIVQIGAKQSVVGALTLVDTKYKIVDIDGDEFIDVDAIGQGAASDDKGGYKALTGSMKYFLAKFFLIPTGDDPEQEVKEGKAKKGEGSATQAKGAATKGGAASPAEQALAMIAKCKDEAKLEDWKAKAMASTVYSAADKKRVVDAIGERLAIITIV